MTRLLDLAQARPLLSAAIAGGLLGLALGVLGPVEIDDVAPASAPDWWLPDRDAVLDAGEERFTAVRGADVWGATATAATARGQGRGGAAAETGAWRLLGVVGQPERRALILRESGGELARMATGETLPDGARLLEIGDTLIRFEREGCQYQRRLFATGPESEPSDCADGQSADVPDATPKTDPDDDR